MNLYNKWRQIFGVSRIDIGTVVSVYDGGAIINLMNGGVARVKGDATVGAVVYIKDGIIIGTAPTTVGSEIEV